MKTALSYPFYLIKFWYQDVSLDVIKYFLGVNYYFSRLFSLELLLRTFFKPLKNEYRKGLVLFSVIFGIFLKSTILLFILFFMLILIVLELTIVAVIYLIPLVLIYLVYAGKSVF